MLEDNGEGAKSAVELGLTITRLRARLRAESTTTTGWTISQLSTLARIIKEGPITASQLAQAEHVRPQSIAEIVTALKTDGLVVARRDPSDGRKALITATAAGKRLIESVSASREAWLAWAIEAVVAPGERRALEKTIDLLNRLAACDLRVAQPIGWRG